MLIKSLHRYLKLFLTFFRFSFYNETAFRANIVFYSISNLIWMLVALTSVELIFGQVNSIAGWAKNEVYLVVFINLLFSDICWTLTFRNMGNFSQWVRRGELDSALLKPVNTRFFLSFMILEFDHYARMAVEFYLIYHYTMLITGTFTLFNLLIFLWLLGCGWLIFYSIFFAITTTNIWFINLANLLDFFGAIQRLGRNPTYIYQKAWFLLFTFVIPAAYTATFPAEALLGRIQLSKIIIAPILAIIFLWGSQKFFRFALKYYSSASS